MSKELRKEFESEQRKFAVFKDERGPGVFIRPSDSYFKWLESKVESLQKEVEEWRDQAKELADKAVSLQKENEEFKNLLIKSKAFINKRGSMLPNSESRMLFSEIGKALNPKDNE